MFYFIEYLRALATALIANSHFKGVYPNDILSFGGGLGLALFYMISGFLLTNINQKTKFSGWYLKKLTRLYLPLWIFRIVELLIGYRKVESFSAFFQVFIFPTYWFVASIVVLYVIYFVFVKYVHVKYKNKAIYIFSIVLVLLFCILYITEAPIGTYAMDGWTKHEFSLETPYVIMQLVWLQCMLIGIWLKDNETILNRSKKPWRYFVVAIGSVLLFMFVKLAIGQEVFLWTRFLLAIAYISFAYSVFRFLAGYEIVCQKVSNIWFGKAIRLVSVCSLEIYYVQFIWINILKDFVFPINFVALCLAIVGSAFILHQVSEWISHGIRRLYK